MPRHVKPTRSPEIHHQSVLEFLSRGPATWAQLETAFPGDYRALKAVLKRLVRLGHVSQPPRGGEYVIASQDRVRGVVDFDRGRLLLAGEPLSTQQHLVRAGDEVTARRTPDGLTVLRVERYGDAPVIGLVKRARRGTWVDLVGSRFRGDASVHGAPKDLQEGDAIAVRVLAADGREIEGEFLEVVARRSSEGGVAELAATTLLNAHGVPVAWPDVVINQAARLPKSVQPGRHADRIDFTEVPLVTIDGEDAKDFDDAVFCERQRDGWRLVVAIADVGNYVKEGSALDREAWQRGNSVYLPDRVVPMLPESLSNGLCSLRPEEFRLAMVCDMRVAASGKVTRYAFHEGIIRSWARLTYTQVAGFLGGAELAQSEPVLESLTELHRVFAALLAAREARGGLDFDTRELSLDLRDGNLVGVTRRERNDAHRLIEEAMIAANVCAARFLERHHSRGLYRVHEAPSGDKEKALRATLSLIGVALPKGPVDAPALKAALQRLHDHPQRWLYETLVLRSMNQARYQPNNLGHFGLALPRYMHFTSPIRRYPDLLVHRAIKNVLNDAPAANDDDALQALLVAGEQCSFTERRAQDVEYGVADWIKCAAIETRVGEPFSGTIVAVTDFGVFVELDDVYVQGLLHISNLGGDYFRLRPGTQSLVGENTGRRYTLGDRLEVLLVSVQPELNKVDLALVQTPGDRKGRGGRPAKNRKGGDRGARGRRERRGRRR